MNRVGTKTPAEREDDQAERLVRPSPKKKPPRMDLRRERVKEKDPDTDTKDPDTTASIAARVATRYFSAAGIKQTDNGRWKATRSDGETQYFDSKESAETWTEEGYTKKEDLGGSSKSSTGPQDPPADLSQFDGAQMETHMGNMAEQAFKATSEGSNYDYDGVLEKAKSASSEAEKKHYYSQLIGAKTGEIKNKADQIDNDPDAVWEMLLESNDEIKNWYDDQIKAVPQLLSLHDEVYQDLADHYSAELGDPSNKELLRRVMKSLHPDADIPDEDVQQERAKDDREGKTPERMVPGEPSDDTSDELRNKLDKKTREVENLRKDQKPKPKPKKKKKKPKRKKKPKKKKRGETLNNVTSRQNGPPGPIQADDPTTESLRGGNPSMDVRNLTRESEEALVKLAKELMPPGDGWVEDSAYRYALDQAIGTWERDRNMAPIPARTYDRLLAGVMDIEWTGESVVAFITATAGKMVRTHPDTAYKLNSIAAALSAANTDSSEEEDDQEDEVQGSVLQEVIERNATNARFQQVRNLLAVNDPGPVELNLDSTRIALRVDSFIRDLLCDGSSITLKKGQSKEGLKHGFLYGKLVSDVFSAIDESLKEVRP